MKKFANNKWISKPRKKIPIKGKRFSIQYFHSYTNQEFFKEVYADDSQQAIAKFQEAIKWDFDSIGTITEVIKK